MTDLLPMYFTPAYSKVFFFFASPVAINKVATDPTWKTKWFKVITLVKKLHFYRPNFVALTLFFQQDMYYLYSVISKESKGNIGINNLRIFCIGVDPRNQMGSNQWRMTSSPWMSNNNYKPNYVICKVLSHLAPPTSYSEGVP